MTEKQTFHAVATFACDGPNGQPGALMAANTVTPLFEMDGRELLTLVRDGVVHLGFIVGQR